MPFVRPSVLLLLVVLTVASATPVHADDHDWADAPPAERATVDRLLASPHWPYRALALVRLERYDAADVGTMITPLLADSQWQVRCFALRAAAATGTPVADDAFARERDGRVIRAVVRHGITIDPDRLRRGSRALMRTRRLDEALLGLEIAAASDDDVLRTEADEKARTLIERMDAAVLARIRRRLVGLIDRPDLPENPNAWREWLAVRRSILTPAADWPREHVPSPLAEASPDEFSRLTDYLDVLRQNQLDLVVVMDATSSMIPMINEARAGVESFILFMNDLARVMRLAFVAYRDYDNQPVTEVHPFTTDVESIRRFLFQLDITGGADLPEAVLEGLTACGKLGWKREAQRQIVLVGDARPHERDVYAVHNLTASFRQQGVVTHAVHVPQQPNEALLRGVRNDAAEEYRAEIADHNLRTARAFADIADAGGGQRITIMEAEALVPSIMHITIEPAWWDAFDAFYALYLYLCR